MSIFNNMPREEDFSNDNMYDSGTQYDGFGRVISGSRRRTSQRAYQQAYDPRERRQVNRCYPGQFGDPRNGQYYRPDQSQYGSSFGEYQEAGRRAGNPQMVNEVVQQVVYDSAELDGTYHNLDNPKGDVRNFVKAEDENAEKEDSVEQQNEQEASHASQEN